MWATVTLLRAACARRERALRGVASHRAGQGAFEVPGQLGGAAARTLLTTAKSYAPLPSKSQLAIATGLAPVLNETGVLRNVPLPLFTAMYALLRPAREAEGEKWGAAVVHGLCSLQHVLSFWQGSCGGGSCLVNEAEGMEDEKQVLTDVSTADAAPRRPGAPLHTK